jgi:Mlc titration factor MtfA (ptsG expression regulator)
MFATLLLIFIIVFVCLAFYLPIWRNRRIRNRPFPSSWDHLLIKNLPVYSALTPEEKKQLQQLIHLFLAKKRFEGCAGLEITDEIKVTITAEACLLLLHHPKTAVYPKLFPSWYTLEHLGQNEKKEMKMAQCLQPLTTFPENPGVMGRSFCHGMM